LPDRFFNFTHHFRHFDFCFGDSKYIFELKIAQVFPKKNEFKLDT
jgi:hypothetical protein